MRRLIEAYRWRRLLASCRLDPRELEKPLEAPGNSDFVIAGCPRSGTSLLAASLFRPPEVITVMEPWDGLRMPPANLFASLRSELETGILTRGRLDVDAARSGSVSWQRDGERSFELDASADFQLGVKWPTFWQYLEYLPDTRFLITVRDPLEVVSSFERTGGRLSQGLEYPVAFNEKMNSLLLASTDDPALRRVLLYQYINSRIFPHLDRDNVFMVRYERWFQDPEALLAEISSFLGTDSLAPNVRIQAPQKPHSAAFERLIDEHAPVARDLGYS